MDAHARLIANEVLAYLVEHPQAQDTMEGITEWWLLQRRIRYAFADVETALSDLVSHDLLVTSRCGDGRTYYRLNRAKEREIRRYVRIAQGTRKTNLESTEPKAGADE